MKEKKHYISLTLKGGNSFHKNGERLVLTERIVNIGETVDCDVRFGSDGMAPEYYASIIQGVDGKHWRIVRRSQYVDIGIAGKGFVGYVYPLTDGDHIQFGNQQMTVCFHAHYDSKYDESGDKYRSHQLVLIAAACFICVVFTFLFLRSKDDISEVDVLPLEESVCMIKVDSVKQVMSLPGVEDSVIHARVVMSDAPTGTAFLTTDGKIITARHCVEYWIGKELDLTTKVENLSEDDIVRWAIETETYNQHHSSESDSKILMKVWFSVYNFLGEKMCSFVSTDQCVHINREKDGLFLLADFSEDYYWRTIRPYFNERKMELGDILWIDGLSEKGKIVLASDKEMETVDRGTRLMICGYPMTETGGKRMIVASGSIKSMPDIDEENLFFESNINYGFSGGPVLMKYGNNIVAVGVVSRVDSISSGLFKWAVPVTEVKNEYE